MLCIPDEETAIGSTETLVYEAIEQMLQELGDWLKSVIIYTGCQTRFVGLDFAGLLKAIERRYPITASHFEESDFPETDGYAPARHNPVDSVLRQLPQGDGAAHNGVLLLNNGFSFSPSNELPGLLGRKLHTIGEVGDWDDFASLANASLSLVTSAQMLATARAILQRQGIPYVYLPTDYRLEGVEDAYGKLAEATGEPIDCTSAANKAKRDIDSAHRVLGNQSISLLAQGCERPWNLARALCEYGFNVESVTVGEYELGGDNGSESQDADMQWLLNKRPDVELKREDRFTGDAGRGGGFRGGGEGSRRRGFGGGMGSPSPGREGYGGRGRRGFDMGQEETALWGYAALSGLMQSLVGESQNPSESGGWR
jgi:hypothetical protein